MSEIFNTILVEKYRPTSLNDLVLDDITREYFKSCIEKRDIPHLLFCGQPGTGKTTLAKILAKELNVTYRYINASDERGIDSIRDKIVPFAQTKSLDGMIKLIILDEADNQTGDCQRALRNTIEEYSENVRFILTANYKNQIIEPIKSRTISFELTPPIKDIAKRIAYIITNENITVPADQGDLLKDVIKSCYPDLRKTINTIQKFSKSGILNIIKIDDCNLIAREILKQIIDKKKINDIREFIIHNETDFGSNYHTLLKGLFECTFESTIGDSKKAAMLLIISDAMYKHQFVMDTEINSFSCILQLSNV